MTAKKLIVFILLAILQLSMLACGGAAEPVEIPSHAFYIGFTPFPYDASLQSVFSTFEVIERDANLITFHYDRGVPWDASLANDFSQFPQDLQEETEGHNILKPKNHKTYLAVTPLSFPHRDSLAPTLEFGGVETNQEPWTSYSFNNADVKEAFFNFCHLMIEKLNPDFFAFAIEVNMLRSQVDDAIWNEYLELAAETYNRLKQAYPDLEVFQTFQVEFYYRDETNQHTAITQAMQYSDILALSAYPFIHDAIYSDGDIADPAQLPSDYFSKLATLAPEKKVAIAETGWIAETLDDPCPITIQANEILQAQYVQWILNNAEELQMPFLTWFFSRDYDALWENSGISDSQYASLVRIWRDTGLYDGGGNPREALSIWRSYLD